MPRGRTRLLGWLSRILHLGRNRHQVISVHDAVVTRPAETAVGREPAATEEDSQTSTNELDRDLIPPVEPAPIAIDDIVESPETEFDRKDASFLDPDDVPVFLPPKPAEIGPSDEQTIAFPVPSERKSNSTEHEPTPRDGADEDVPRPPRNEAPKAAPAATPTNDSTRSDEFGHLFE